MPRVVDVRAFIIESGGGYYHSQQPGHWMADSLIATPMSIYPPYRGSQHSWGMGALGAVVVEVETDGDRVGVGVSTGGEAACFIIERHLRRFIVGQDPRNVELIWDQMWRATIPYGRKGLALHAISAVDLAIWDVLGKLREEPIYALLGGQTKERLPVYATSPKAKLAQDFGFLGAKLPLRHGPGDGRAGLLKNVAMVAEAREQVGPDYELMIDCYMSLTVAYAIELAKSLAPYRVRWIEEALLPDDYEGYARLRTCASNCLWATGEHEYTRYGFRQLIERKAADILQPDIAWVGGLTEMRRIVALASAYDLPVILHGGGVFSYHVPMAFTNCPMAEFQMMSPKADKVVPVFGDLFIAEPLPHQGMITLSDSPGWGIELNRGSIRLHRPYPADLPPENWCG